MTSRRITAFGGLLAAIGAPLIALSTSAVAAADDFQISIDGIDLFPTAGNTATATSGLGDIAIADGFDSNAIATGGLFDFAYIDGSGDTAFAGNGNFDVASILGADSTAYSQFGNDDLTSVVNSETILDQAGAGGINATTLGDFDIASVVGTGSSAFAGADLVTPGSVDLAVAFGNALDALATGGSFLADILP